MVLGLLFHLIAFIVAIVAACRKGHPFPSFWVAGIFFVAGNLVTPCSSSAKILNACITLLVNKEEH